MLFSEVEDVCYVTNGRDKVVKPESVDLDPIIQEGKRLVSRLNDYPGDIGPIPTEQRITVAEIDAWWDAATAALKQIFGQHSDLVNEWNSFRKSQYAKFYEDSRNTGARGEAVLYANMLNRAIGFIQRAKLMKEAGTQIPVNWRAGATWEKVIATIAFLLGCVALGFILWAALSNRAFDNRAYSLLRTVLALAAGAFVFAFPGFITVEVIAQRLTVRAAGAFAVFVLLYLVTPAI